MLKFYEFQVDSINWLPMTGIIVYVLFLNTGEYFQSVCKVSLLCKIMSDKLWILDTFQCIEDL